MEKKRQLSTEEYNKYSKAVDEYCLEIDKLKKKLIIKIVFLSMIILGIVICFYEKQTGMYGKTGLIWIPMFFIGKNIGQNKKVLDIAGLARKEIRQMIIVEDVVNIESCFVDKTFNHNYRSLFLRIPKRYILVSNKGERYLILNKPKQEFYMRDPILTKIIYTRESRVVVDMQIIKEEKYHQGADMELGIDEKIARIERITDTVWTYKDIKLPYIKLRYREEYEVYFVIDVFYSGIVEIRNQRNMNIICRKISGKLKEYLYSCYSFEIENNKKEIGNIIIDILQSEIEELNVTNIKYDYVARKLEDNREYIEL